MKVPLTKSIATARLYFRPVGRWLRRAWGYLPLSGPGLALTLTLAAGFKFLGMERSDQVLLITGGAMLAAAVVDMLVVILTAAYIAWRFRQQKLNQDGGQFRLDLVTDFPAPSSRHMPRFMPPLIEASTHILNPPDFQCEWRRREDQVRQEWLIPGRRCELEENFRLRRRVLVKDVLGFATIDWEQEEPLSLRVLPKPMPLQSHSLIRAWFQGDDISDPRGDPQGDRVDMRRYSPGDPPRLLLWKIYARTGKLMVRIPEAAVTTAPRTCAYLVSGPGDETVASLARTLVENDLLGDGWRFGADGSDRNVERKEEALRLIARSGNPGTVTGKGLPYFLKEAATAGFGSCILLLPPTDGDWVEVVAQAIARSPLSVSLLTVGSVGSRPEGPKWHRWVFYEQKTHTDPNELFARLNCSSVTDWLTFDPVSQRLIPLRGSRSSGSETS